MSASPRHIATDGATHDKLFTTQFRASAYSSGRLMICHQQSEARTECVNNAYLLTSSVSSESTIDRPIAS